MSQPLTVVFVGGGSLRILPILRAAFNQTTALNGGEVRLVDRLLPRAEAVGRLVQRTPEYADSHCRITWDDNLDRALEGADILYVTMAVGDPATGALSHQASVRRGFLSSDNLSLTGAFLGLTAGPVILGFARRMERLCPQATMLIFANPVAVYSAAVNNHTTIRALGICGGFNNHRWDLPRLFGRDVFDPDFDVDSAGVNHLAFILRGRYHGQDLIPLLQRQLAPGYRPPPLNSMRTPLARRLCRASLRRLRDLVLRFDTTIFSTEGDGMAHLFQEEMFPDPAQAPPHVSAAKLRRQARNWMAHRDAPFTRFAEHLDRDLDTAFWEAQTHGPFGRAEHDVAIPLFHALAGLGVEKIAASAPCRGAVAGFTERTVLEYTQFIDDTGIRPASDLYVPAPFQSLISGLAVHQTLLADAIATEDPRVLADALFAYPVQYHTANARALHRELLTIHRAAIPAVFEKTKDYL